MARLIVFIGAVACAVVLALQPFTVSGMTTRVDRISIDCWKTNSGFALKIEYTASTNRLILANVTDARGKGHRIMRYRVKAGKKTLTWSARKNRFGALSQGCVAMHKVSSQGGTVAWDCDKF